MDVTISTSSFCEYIFSFAFSGCTVEHNAHDDFYLNAHLTCTVQHETTFYTCKMIVGHMVWVVLCNYWLGVIILENFEQQRITHLK